jgi:hypothetical protein
MALARLTPQAMPEDGQLRLGADLADAATASGGTLPEVPEDG